MDPLAVSAYGAEQALPLTGNGTGDKRRLRIWCCWLRLVVWMLCVGKTRLLQMLHSGFNDTFDKYCKCNVDLQLPFKHSLYLNYSWYEGSVVFVGPELHRPCYGRYFLYADWWACHAVLCKHGLSFASVGPKLWNSLPDDITLASSLSVFRKKLKTHLFQLSYPDVIL